jgi:hypothetical protein
MTKNAFPAVIARVYPKQSRYLDISGLLHSVRNDAAFVISLFDKRVYWILDMTAYRIDY